MKKSLLLKTLASISAVAVLGVSTLIGASAAEGPLKLKIEDVTGKAGDTVAVAISAENNPALEGIGGTIEFDEALTIGTAKTGSLLDGGLFMIDAESDSFIFAGSASEVSEDTEGTIGIINFTIPEDAEPGTVYDITWVLLDDYSNVDGSVDVDEENLINGSITVEGEVTTPAETEAETEATTTAATTTPAATVPSAPKTGASTKGIAATTAVLLAAACSAVVLKKKRD